MKVIIKLLVIVFIANLAWAMSLFETAPLILYPEEMESQGVAWVDCNNDGDTDLAISGTGKPLLYLNGTTTINFLVLTFKGNGTTNTNTIGFRVPAVANITGQGGTDSHHINVSSGIYFLHIYAGEVRTVQKLTLIR